ncbi:MAG TPA: DUF5781 family protein [Candidatus Bathyarchaeia archaeon]|nr:DUF5781 family protein [Candidatus Bathyarchaeia archaeon]
MPSENAVLSEALRKTLKLMKEAGFEILHDVKVSIDPELPFMGYSTKMGSKGVIVVSGKAVKSGMVEGLLMHEMCHIYRTDTHHPSHNHKLLDRVGFSVLRERNLRKGYQIKVLQEAINHVQDLYADDVSFQVFSRSRILPLARVLSFFLNWIEEAPMKSGNAKTAWMNVGTMLNNCFVLSNMERHGVTGVDDLAEKKANKFLSRSNKRMSKEFLYIRDYMVNLRENPTENEFEEGLSDYLRRVIRLADECTATR